MAVTLDIEKGDILLGGRFKNHKTVVDTLGTDSLGQPTVNGMKLLSFRIAKKMPKEANVDDDYIHGFIDKCAEYGIDPEVLFLKQALSFSVLKGLFNPLVHAGKITAGEIGDVGRMVGGELSAAPKLLMSDLRKLWAGRPKLPGFKLDAVRPLPKPVTVRSE